MAYTVSDLMVQQAPQIGPMINQKIMGRPTPWITLGRKETWSDEISSVQKTFQFDRAMLSDPTAVLTQDLVEEVDWANVATSVSLNDAQANHLTGTGDGLPPADTVEFTQTLRDYRLQHKAVWGPPMNTNNLRDKFVRVKQMGACTDALADQGRELQIDRARSEYKRVADKLVVLDSAFSLSTSFYGKTAFPAPSGTDHSILTNGFTDIIYEYLNHQGAAGDALGQAGGSAGYSLITSPRQSRRLIMADPDVREDFRYSSQNEGLLAAMGKKWSYNGFVHTCDEKVDRWEHVPASSVTIAVVASTGVCTFSGALVDSNGNTVRLYKGSTIIVTGTDACKLEVVGRHATANLYYVKSAEDGVAMIDVTPAVTTFTAWAKVPQFYVTTVTAGDGNSRLKRIPNPSWLTATWEDSYIYHQGVCTTLVPKPITSVGQASFPAMNYAGSYRWTNYPDKTLNPDGSIGQFRGTWSNGTRPDSPEFGVVIRHLAVANPDGRIMDGSSLG